MLPVTVALRPPTRPPARSAVTDDVLGAVWFESLAGRADLHRALRVGRCDTAVAGRDVRFGPGVLDGPGPALRVDGACPCRDYVLDLLVEADRFLRSRGPGLRNPAGAVRTHLRVRVAGDWIRAARVARGAQARTDRIRRSARGNRLPDELHRAVLEYLVDEAGSPGPLDGQGQLLDRLAERAAREFGGTAQDRRADVVAALPRIEAVCREGRRSVVDGVELTWWERYVEIPLGRRDGWGPAVVADPGPEREPVCPVAEQQLASVLDVLDHGPGGTDAVVLERVLGALVTGAAGGAAGPERAVARALAELVRLDVVPDAAADPARLAEVVAAARAVPTLPAPRRATG